MNVPLRILPGAFALLFFSPQLGFAQTSAELKAVQRELQALRKEIQALKEGQVEIQRGVKKILRQRRAPDANVLSFSDDPFNGDEGAKVTLIDFSDYG